MTKTVSKTKQAKRGAQKDIKLKNVNSRKKETTSKKDKSAYNKDAKLIAKVAAELINQERMEKHSTDSILAVADKHNIDANDLAAEIQKQGGQFGAYDMLLKVPCDWTTEEQVFVLVE
jgi:hypothetical protein